MKRNHACIVTATFVATLATPALALAGVNLNEGHGNGHANGHGTSNGHGTAWDGVIVANNPGSRYESLMLDFWEYALNVPSEQNPWFTNGEFCSVNQSGSTWFLAGALGGGSAYRTGCKVPKGKRLFIPVHSQFYGAFTTDPAAERTDEYLLDRVSCVEDTIATLTVDGTSYDVSDFNFYSEIRDVPITSASPFYGAFPDDVASPAVVGGVHVVLEKLPVGHHVLHWVADSATCYGGFSVDVTYELEVVQADNG